MNRLGVVFKTGLISLRHSFAAGNRFGHGLAKTYSLSRCSELVYIELSYYFVPTAVLKKERSGLRD